MKMVYFLYFISVMVAGPNQGRGRDMKTCGRQTCGKARMLAMLPLSKVALVG